jgi:cytochrome c-type biogenesis protein CcmH
MSGWVGALIVSALVVAGLLLFTQARKQLWPVVLAAVVLGLAGYAWQGQAALRSAPAEPIKAQSQAADTLLAMRAQMDTNYGAGKQYLILADSYARDGDYRYAAAFIQSGLNKYPRDGDLWAGLGVILYLAGEAKMSAPAELAFANARKYHPANRAPDYFNGMAALFDGRPQETLALWQKLVDDAPDKAVWKPKLESQLQGLKAMLQSAQPADVN